MALLVQRQAKDGRYVPPEAEALTRGGLESSQVALEAALQFDGRGVDNSTDVSDAPDIGR